MSENEGAETPLDGDGEPAADIDEEQGSAGGASADAKPEANEASVTGGEPDAEAATDEAADGEPNGTPPDADPELVERVDEASTDQLAGEIAALRDRVEMLERTIDDREETIEELESKLKRKQADFQNFKKRQERKREEERQRATEDLVERLLDVRDNLVRALDQDEGSDIRSGIETTLRQFDRVFDSENVQTIDPDPGADVDPGRHEVLMRLESDEEAGTVADLHRPGYEMAGKVLRPAQVTVADDSEE